MDIVKKEYYEINLNERLSIRYEGEEGSITRNYNNGLVFERADLEDLMVAFNWLYHEIEKPKPKL